MSKIPQGEWSAIAARYAQGESISKIAQSYGCTPPAIHYILKRNKARAASTRDPQLNGRPESAAGAVRDPSRPPPSPAISRSPEPHHLQASRDRGPAAPAKLMPSEQRATLSPSQQPAGPRKAGRASAFTAGLDHELHVRAEAAIEAFRSSFDAALTESSPSVRQRLREAASDLMRVAARTTIVLDRLNANAERASPRLHDHLS
jgi:transposase-like protein